MALDTNTNKKEWFLDETDLQRVLNKAKNNMHPLREVNYQDVEGLVLNNKVILSRDHWAQSWITLAEKYKALGIEKLEKGLKSEASELLQKAIRYYYVGRWPLANSLLKKEAYASLREVFVKLSEIPSSHFFEILNVPYQGQLIKAYLKRPITNQAVPVVLHWGGIDTWKEDLNHLANAYLSQNWASIVVDMPGTGESGELASPTAEAIFSAILDYIKTRKELDSQKVVVQGSSWGGYWATKLAFIEAGRLKGAVNWGGPVHDFFSKKWQEKSLNSTEYLFDVKEAVMSLYGTNDFSEYLDKNQKMSLLEQGLLSKHAAPILYINGQNDSLVPFSDTKIISKYAANARVWSNPVGIHMGIGGRINHQYLISKVILPFIKTLFERQ